MYPVFVHDVSVCTLEMLYDVPVCTLEMLHDVPGVPIPEYNGCSIFYVWGFCMRYTCID